MLNTMADVMRYLNNYFDKGYIDGKFEVSDDGVLSPTDGIVSGQYIAIEGSINHDGVYPCTDGWLGYDEEIPFGEEFQGRVWLLHPPASFVKLCRRISDFQKESEKVSGPYTSESFAGYSYSKATSKSGGAVTWQETFERELMPYRRMFTEVSV